MDAVPDPDALPPTAEGVTPDVPTGEVVARGETVACKAVRVGGEDGEVVKVGRVEDVWVEEGEVVGNGDNEETSELEAPPEKEPEGESLGAPPVADTEEVEDRVGLEDCDREGDLEEVVEKAGDEVIEGDRVTLNGVAEGQGEELLEPRGEREPEGDIEKELDPLGLRLVRPLREAVRDRVSTLDAEGEEELALEFV